MVNNTPRQAIIIGAGPAGLTAAYELLQRTDIVPVILEKSGDIGGISKTVNYKGNRMDIGGHRFFSKSDRVMQWWLNIMPIQPMKEKQFIVTYQRHTKTITTEEPASHCQDEQEMPDKVMLVRKRLSRVYFLRKFFIYPIQLSLDTLRKLGLARTIAILLSYCKARLFPRKQEDSLEDFFINRFGNKLYRLFFKDYTEKVWGVPCTRISAEWGAQRIKGVSVGKALVHAVRSLRSRPTLEKEDIGQKNTETSLIERFLYPKFGPGQLWEEVARQIQERGGRILFHQDVKNILSYNHRILAVEAINNHTEERSVVEGDYFFSTMPVQELIAGMRNAAPTHVKEIAAGLQYRDFITVGVLLKKMSPPGQLTDTNSRRILPDTWVYIQEKDVKVGRLQIFNNWSPFMVKDPDTVWIGMEYFCNKGDTFWELSDEDIQTTAIMELEQMGLGAVEDVLDSTVLRMEKTYPAYFGTYSRFEEIRQFTDQFTNLFLVGRNGMHKYNNSDHSMLTAMVAVDNIVAGITEKANIWSINTEQEYHEEKPGATAGTGVPGKEAPIRETPLPPADPVPARAAASFKDFLFRDRQNRAFLWIAGISIIVQFIIFKFLYPHAGFISGDSYVYLQTAFWNSSINTYPVGYSNFLRLFSIFTYSDTALVACQYLMLECAALILIYSVFYFYKPGRFVRIFLYVFIVFNPVFLYLSNYISSDALFISLSLLWFTLLLWILEREDPRFVIAQVLVLFYAFTVRYNALYYPLITTLALILSRQKTYVKLVGIAASVLVIGIFIWHTSNRYYEQTGIRQFSPFSGWQMANNALYAYRYVDSSHIQPVPERFRELNKLVRNYFDTTKDVSRHPQEMLVANTWYMWNPRSPLQQYMNNLFKGDSTTKTLKKWAVVGPIYADYGNYLIRRYPGSFARHYLWPNALKYYAPPVEFLDTYNMGRDTIAEIAQTWFRLKSNKAKSAFNDYKVNVLDFYPILSGTLNVLFVFSLLFFGMLRCFKRKHPLYRILLLTGCFWLVNFGFSVFASPIALRFQIFPVMVFVPCTLLLMEYIYKVAFITPDLIRRIASPQDYADTLNKTKLAATKIITVLLLMTILQSCHSRPKLKTGEEGKTLPSFSLLLADSITHFNTANITPGSPTILFYYSPFCPFCRAETEDIIANIKKVAGIRFYMITPYPFRDMRSFYNSYHLEKYPNITAGRDDSNYFARYLKVQSVPYLAIYDSRKRLKQVVIGKTNIDIIREIAYN